MDQENNDAHSDQELDNTRENSKSPMTIIEKPVPEQPYTHENATQKNQVD
ncbi:hypothetical protein ACFLWV_03875 [Chloroflexota bacterium]